ARPSPSRCACSSTWPRAARRAAPPSTASSASCARWAIPIPGSRRSRAARPTTCGGGAAPPRPAAPPARGGARGGAAPGGPRAGGGGAAQGSPAEAAGLAALAWAVWSGIQGLDMDGPESLAALHAELLACYGHALRGLGELHGAAAAFDDAEAVWQAGSG